MAHVDDFNAVLNGSIYDDVPSTGHGETAMTATEFGMSYPKILVVSQQVTALLKAANEWERIRWAALRDEIINLLKVVTSLRSK